MADRRAAVVKELYKLLISRCSEDLLEILLAVSSSRVLTWQWTSLLSPLQLGTWPAPVNAVRRRLAKSEIRYIHPAFPAKFWFLYEASGRICLAIYTRSRGSGHTSGVKWLVHSGCSNTAKHDLQRWGAALVIKTRSRAKSNKVSLKPKAIYWAAVKVQLAASWT